MQKRKLSKKKSFVALTAIMCMALLGLALFRSSGSTTGKEAELKPMARPVKTMTIEKTHATETRSFPGIVRAAAETELAFRVGGPLIEFDVRIGQRVEKGEVIARIDPRDFEISVRRLSAALTQARANLKAMRAGARAEDIEALKAQLTAARSQMTEAKRNFERYGNLLGRHAISQSQHDQAEAAYDAARTNVDALTQELKKARTGARAEDIEAAEAGIQGLSADLQAAENALGDTRLVAPFSGYINRKHVENHENVKDGDPIASLLDCSSVEVRTAIPEDLVIRKPSFAELSCTLDAYPGQRFEATLKEVGHKTDRANQSYPMTVTLHIPDHMVVDPGMAATVSISLKNQKGPVAGFVLPATAVFADTKGDSCVWRIDPRTMRVIRTRVTTGDLKGESVEVLSGLNPGERVVTAGARFLRDNQQVRVLHKHREAGS